ncbi:MAG TPA: YggS family pyridoxal phosphate-dependent enzyme [Gemmatimonadaceae bacterium]|nr:YggS family pyridoxal phosphate-dependent enzyme [Gemmatimonadaceae bacterium]
MPFLDLPDRVREVRERIDAAARRGGRGGAEGGGGQSVTIVAVTKTHGPEALRAAWDAGLRDVGENRVQEALDKMDVLNLSFRWHLIGHLQRNKVKHLTRFHLLHAMDRPALADAVDALAASTGGGRVFDVLMQVNILGESTKGGYALDAVSAEAERLHGLAGLRLRGVMTMAPFDADEKDLRAVFGGARKALDAVRAAGHEEARELSMGMSNDYEIAVEEGATCVRLGTVLFGARTGGHD